MVVNLQRQHRSQRKFSKVKSRVLALVKYLCDWIYFLIDWSALTFLFSFVIRIYLHKIMFSVFLQIFCTCFCIQYIPGEAEAYSSWSDYFMLHTSLTIFTLRVKLYMTPPLLSPAELKHRCEGYCKGNPHWQAIEVKIWWRSSQPYALIKNILKFICGLISYSYSAWS